jgi:hypothetical protein
MRDELSAATAAGTTDMRQLIADAEAELAVLDEALQEHAEGRDG